MVRSQPFYEEQLTSNRTTALFALLAFVFLALFAMRLADAGTTPLTVVLLCLSVFFAFYTVNYRSLTIRVSNGAVRLRFGIFRKTVPADVIEDCHLDRTSLWRIGGAGIHFTLIGGKYRMYLNFLEHPRVVLELGRGAGLVRAVAFSTRRPGALLDAIAKILPAGRHQAI